MSLEENNSVSTPEELDRNDSAEAPSPFGKRSVPALIGLVLGIAAALAFIRSVGLGVLGSAIVGALIALTGSAVGQAGELFFNALAGKDLYTVDDTRAWMARLSLAFGTIGLIAWIIPIIGIPITVAGFFLGSRGSWSSLRKLALVGMGLSLVGILLSCINGYLGALMAVRSIMGEP